MSGHEKDSELSPWWGTFSIEENSGGRWDVGPSTVWIYRTPNEWRVFHRPAQDANGADAMADRSLVALPVAEGELPGVGDADQDFCDVSRHGFRKTLPEISVMPALADRSIITRPEHPMFVPAGESVTLYVSTPLWIMIELFSPKSTLREIASFRMSDTWFGPSTRTGELCYATRTTGRFRRQSLPHRLHRAITPVRILNRAEDALSLERIQLPTRHLSIFQAPDDALWTEVVTMTRSAGAEGAGVEIKAGPPADAFGAKLIREPRDPMKKGLFTHTFGAVSSLFSS